MHRSCPLVRIGTQDCLIVGVRVIDKVAHIVVLELERVRRICLNECNLTVRIARLSPRIHADVVPVDFSAKAAVFERQHGVAAADIALQLEIVFVKIVDALNGNVLAAHVQHVIVDGTVRAVVAVYLRIREVSRIRAVLRAEVHNIVRCPAAGTLCRLAAVDVRRLHRRADGAARDGDDVAVRTVADAARDLLRDCAARDGNGIFLRAAVAADKIIARVSHVGCAAVDTLRRAGRHGDAISLDRCLILSECTAQDLCRAGRAAKVDGISAQLSLAVAVCTGKLCRRTIGEDDLISCHLHCTGRVVKIAARDIPRRCAAVELHLVVRNRALAKGISAIEQMRRAVLHVGGVVIDCTRVILGTRHAAVDLLHEICGICHIDGDRVRRDIARRALVPAAVGILRIVRTMHALHRQHVVRRRMSVVGNTAIDSAAVGRRCAVIGDAPALKAVDDPHDGFCRGFIRIRHQRALMGIRRGIVPRRIVCEMQVVRPNDLQESHAVHALYIRDVVRRNPRAINADLRPVDARAAECARVRHGEHRIAVREGMI